MEPVIYIILGASFMHSVITIIQTLINAVSRPTETIHLTKHEANE